MLRSRRPCSWANDHGSLRAHMVVLAAALALVPPDVVRADPATGADATPAPTEEVGPLQEIVVTATRHEESLSKVPISVTALNQEAMDMRGIKDILDVARFTPGINIDNSGTNNIAIRGIASTGGAGTTGIYLDDTPIQMRALAFNPDDALPQSFDLDRVEILRGPQGTLFGAGSEGGTVRYITTQPSLTATSLYSRNEVSYTQGGEPNYEAGVGAGTPIIDGTLGIRITAWYRYDGGYTDLVNPQTGGMVQSKANYAQTKLVRIALLWQPVDNWKVTPSYYYQDRYLNNVENYWPLFSDPGNNRFVNGNPDQRPVPDTFYIGAFKIEGDLGKVNLISNTSVFHRNEMSGYEGTIYNLGFYQAQGSAPVFAASPVSTATCASGYTFPNACFPLLDATGLHLPPGIAYNYRSPASVANTQQNLTQEIRLQSADSHAPLVWTTGIFYSSNRQTYLEQIYDPMLNNLTEALFSQPYQQLFSGISYDPHFPNDSYFLQTYAKDKQIALFGEGTYSFTDQWKTTVGVRFSRTEFSFNTLTGGPQLFLPNQTNSGDKKENSFTPKVSVQYQYDPRDLYYFTYAKGFRPGGANNPVPAAACGTDFANFGITQAPATYNSDTVDSYEIGAKNNFANRFKIASSVYYIRWHNIQQTVVPPICQISFIDNLGQAVAKGADIQAELAFTDNFTAELTAGYTDARYTQDSRLSPTETTPVVANGDAIIGQGPGGTDGQPGPPVTASLGLEYRFTAFTRESFVRVDDEYQGRPKWVGANQDPNTLQFDPANYKLSSTNFASARAGMNFDALRIEAFCDNLTDSHTITNYEWSIDSSVGASRLQRQYTFRPRTAGFTFIYRMK